MKTRWVEKGIKVSIFNEDLCHLCIHAMDEFQLYNDFIICSLHLIIRNN